MAIAEKTVRKIINVRKDGTRFSEAEWVNCWSNLTIPLTEETNGFYQSMAGMIKKENDLNRTPEKLAVKVISQ